MSTRTSPIIRLLAFLMMMTVLLFSAKAQSFSYNSPICVNGPVLFPNLSPGFPTGGSFIASPGGLNLLIGNGQINPPQSQPGTYTISYVGSTCGCILSTIVTIHNLTAVSINNTTVCATGTVVPLVVAASPSTGLSYTWAPAGVVGPTINIFPPYVNQTLTVSITDANGCGNQASATISVVAGPQLNVSGNGSVCPGGQAILTANGSGISYLWNTGATGNSINVSPQVTTVYTATASDASGCKSTATRTVVVNTLSLAVTGASMCAGTTLTLTATASPNNGVSYLWYPGPLTGATVSVSPPATQNYTVVANRAGCTASRVIQVLVSPSFTPVTGFSYKSPLCTDSPDQLPVLVSGFSPGGVFSAVGPAELELDDTTGAVTMAGITPGVYYINYTLPLEGCMVGNLGTATLAVGVSGKVDVVSDVIIFKGASAMLQASGGTYYNWEPPLYIDCATCDTPRVSPPESMRYCVTSDLCLDGGCVNVTVLCKNEGDLSVPNAFTPDGDGNNDKFCLQGWEACVRKFEILIFDRWGTKMYESADPSFCWDGVFNGQALNSGVYTYVITATYDAQPLIVKKGTITIIR